METNNPIPTKDRLDEKGRDKRRRFALSTSNKIYYALVALLSAGLFFALPEKTPYAGGVFFGKLVSFLLYPALIAWFVWWIRGKKQRSRGWTFNIVLTLMLVGQINQVDRRREKSQIAEDMQEELNEFKAEKANQDDPEKFDRSLQSLANTAQDSLGQLSELSDGDESRYYTIMQKYTADSFAMSQGWVECFDALQSPRIFNFSSLDDKEEVEHQKNVLSAYVNKTIEYGEYFENLVPELRKRLEVLDEEDAFVKGLIKGAVETAKKKYRSQEPVFNPLIQAHIEYGNGMIQIIDLLTENREGWEYEGKEVQFLNESLQEDFGQRVDLVIEREDEINRLTNELIRLQ